MNFWHQASVVRLLFPFILGILAVVFFEFRIPFFEFSILPPLALLILFSHHKNVRFTYRFRWVNGILVSLLFFMCGAQLTISNTAINSENHYVHLLQKQNFALAQINEAPVDKGKSIRAEVKLIGMKQEDKWKTCFGKAMISLARDSMSTQLHYGDLLLLHTSFNAIPAPQNPSEFNYRRYLQFHNIHFQAYCKASAWINLKQNRGNVILKKCLALRDYLLKVFRENGISGQEYAVGAALILGYEDKLDAEIMNAYAASGALHVLSVSGLHIAIVLVILNSLLFFLDRFKRGSLLKALILLFLLWVYAALTGLSPSVLRSAAMFSLIIIGKSLDRHTNIYNTLATSMLALLIWNPFLLMEVGFQLSYLAVLGIVSFQAAIQGLWEPRNKLLQHIWTLTGVSIAAQLSTFPLGLFYFHQFPNYFLLSNLIVIPVSTAVLYLGVAVCLLAKLKLATVFLCKLLSGSLWFLNAAVLFFEQLPHSVIQGISLTVLESSLLYMLMGSFFLFFSFRKIVFLISGCAVVGLLLVALVVEKYAQLQQEKWVIYNVKNHSAIDFITGDKNYFFADNALLQNEGRMLFHVKHNWWDLGLSYSHYFDQRHLQSGFQSPVLKSKNFIIQFNAKKIIYICPQNVEQIKSILIAEPIDYIVLSANVKIHIGKLHERIKFKKVIFDSSNSKGKIRFWKEQCKVLKMEYYDVLEQGAFVEEL
ncbi:MAG: ComEC family competence protein [Bacteroidetes bacterium]|nr:ComEC family competence protein [Bacteroidota bacterium]